MRKPKPYIIEKYFRGGKGVYFANMPWGIRMKKGYWKFQLDEWGRETIGGHCYGYQIYARRPTKRNPVPKKATELYFNPKYFQ